MVQKIITYALVSTRSCVSSGWEHVPRLMHPWSGVCSICKEHPLQSMWLIFLLESGTEYRYCYCYASGICSIGKAPPRYPTDWWLLWFPKRNRVSPSPLHSTYSNPDSCNADFSSQEISETKFWFNPGIPRFIWTPHLISESRLLIYLCVASINSGTNWICKSECRIYKAHFKKF